MCDTMKRERRNTKEPPELSKEQHEMLLSAIESRTRKVIENTDIIPGLSKMSPEEYVEYSNSHKTVIKIPVLLEKIMDICDSEYIPEELKDILGAHAYELWHKCLESTIKVCLPPELVFCPSIRS